MGDIGNIGNAQKAIGGKDAAQVCSKDTLGIILDLKCLLHHARLIISVKFLYRLHPLSQNCLHFSFLQGRSGVLTRRAAAQLAAVTGPVAHGQVRQISQPPFQFQIELLRA